MRMQGTVAMPRSFAASTRQWPARMVCAASISTGLVKPKVRMLSATWRICFFEWVRALRAHGLQAGGLDLLEVGGVARYRSRPGRPGVGTGTLE